MESFGDSVLHKHEEDYQNKGALTTFRMEDLFIFSGALTSNELKENYKDKSISLLLVCSQTSFRQSEQNVDLSVSVKEPKNHLHPRYPHPYTPSRKHSLQSDKPVNSVFLAPALHWMTCRKPAKKSKWKSLHNNCRPAPLTKSFISFSRSQDVSTDATKICLGVREPPLQGDW